MDAVVLAGGTGKRLLPLTKYTPKPFLRIAGKRLYRYSIDQLASVRSSIDRAVLITPPRVDGLANDLPEWMFSVEQVGDGIEGGIETGLKALEGGSQEIIVSFTGYLAWPVDIVRQTLDFYSVSGYQVVMSIAPVATGVETYGFVKMGVMGRVEELREEPEEEWLYGRGYVFAGVMIGDRRALMEIVKRGYIAGLNYLARNGLLGATIWGGEWAEIGYPWDILEVPNILFKSTPAMISPSAVIERTATITGRVYIGANAYIGDNVVIKGPAYIGRGSKIGDGTVIKPGSLIEDGALIGPNCVIESSVVMENAVVSALSHLEKSIVGERAQIKALSILEAGEPKELPERLEGIARFMAKKPTLGAIIAPRAALGPRAYHGYGEIVD
ncbi:MAG: NDP-sugar synthase [Desulfurococcales archaeon]|nr:NDP-sugar synthase [Desulfurococcales archaeon]